MYLPVASLKDRVLVIFIIMIREMMFQAISHARCFALSLLIQYQLLYISQLCWHLKLLQSSGFFAFNVISYLIVEKYFAVSSDTINFHWRLTQRAAESVRTFCHNRLVCSSATPDLFENWRKSHVISADLYHHHFGLEKKLDDQTLFMLTSVLRLMNQIEWLQSTP